MQEQKFKDKWGIKLFIRTALNTWEVILTYKQELLCLNHIKSSWRRLPSSTQKSLYLWSFPYIINILRSHLQLVLDIHWKNLSYWVTESLSSRLHTCGCTKAGQKSPNPTFTQTAECFTFSLMCYSTVARGSSMSHHHALRYLFRQFYKSAALLLWTKYGVGIQALNFLLTSSHAPVPCCSADN